MADFLLRLLKALVDSLFVLFGRIPALEQLRRAFSGAGTGVGTELLWVLILFAAVAGIALFFLFLRLLRNAPLTKGGRTLKEFLRGER